MKKLPKIYQNEFDKKINNNKVVFDGTKEEDDLDIEDIKEDYDTNKEISNTLTVKEKIKELIQQNKYIFNTKVSLVFKDHEEPCEIAGIVNNHIITMDNQIIKIEDLKDIKILE